MVRGIQTLILLLLFPILAEPSQATVSPLVPSARAVINLRDVGAKGDGVTDDQSALEQAFAQAGNTPGAVLYAPSGRYKHSGTLSLKGVTLVGDGAGSIFEAANPLNAAIMLSGDSPRLSNVKLICDLGTQTRSRAGPSAMVVIAQATHFQVDHLVITGGASVGILNLGGTGTSDQWAQIDDNTISGTLADGIHNTQRARYVLVTHNTVSNTGDDMIAVVSYVADGGKSTDIEISSNTLSANVGRGITVVGGDRVSILDNTIKSPALAGLYFASEGTYDTFGDDRITAKGNIIESACKAPCASGLPGIFAQGRPDYPITHLQVTGNTVRNSTRDSVLLNHDVIGPVLQNNLLDGWGRFGIYNLAATSAQLGGNTFTLQSFDPRVGEAGYNCRSAFQQAFATMGPLGGGTLAVPAGTFLIDFPDVPMDIGSAPALAKRGLIIVSSHTVIEGTAAPDGTPASILEWKISSVPVFTFSNASYSGMKMIHARYLGTLPSLFPYGDIALLTALGYSSTYPHLNQMGGGNYELFSFIYGLNSEYCQFDHLVFDSATRDNEHTFGFGLNLKGKGVVTTLKGGGLNALADGNQISNLTIYDDIMGILATGQSNLLIENITADRRGSTMAVAPGHVIYMSGQLEWAADGTGTPILNKNVTIKNITEGPHTYSNVHSGGTLAIKFIDGGQISEINSQHPLGLVQTLYVDQHVAFNDMHWQSDYALCANTPDNCGAAVISSAISPAGYPSMENITVENVTLKSTVDPIRVMLYGDHVVVSHLAINTPPVFLPGQINTAAILGFAGHYATITDYSYTPLLSAFNSKQHYDSPFTAWQGSTSTLTSDVEAHVTIYWPQTVPLPSPPNSTYITLSEIQHHDLNDVTRDTQNRCLVQTTLITTTTTSAWPPLQLNLPSTLPINGSVRLHYDPGADHSNVTYTWTVEAATSPVASSSRGSTLNSGSTSTGLKTPAPAMALASWQPTPGLYRISVQASDGQSSSNVASQTVSLVAEDSGDLRIYPNPWKRNKNTSGITFDSVAAGSQIKIFTISGHEVAVLDAKPGRAIWDLTTKSGDRVASGIYVCLAMNGQNQKTTKTFAIVQ